MHLVPKLALGIFLVHQVRQRVVTVATYMGQFGGPSVKPLATTWDGETVHRSEGCCWLAVSAKDILPLFGKDSHGNLRLDAQGLKDREVQSSTAVPLAVPISL